MQRGSYPSNKVMAGFNWVRLCGLMAVAVVAAGSAAALWMGRSQDARMRSELLVQGRLVADILNPWLVVNLTGMPSDLDSPDYQQIKSQLQLMRSANGKFRFLYLTKQLPDGRVAFLADSEPGDSPDHSPPGQIYEEATDTFREVFVTGRETVEGPARDRWGNWISSLIPIKPAEGASAVAVLGIDVDASNWGWDIFEHCLPAAALSLLGLSGLGFLAVLFRRAETARERIAASEALLAESAERLRLLFSNMAEGVVLHELILDGAGNPSNYRMIDCNPQCERILGFKRTEIVGRLATEVYRTRTPPYLAEFSRVALSGVPARLEAFFAPMERHFDISIAPWGCNGFATIFADVTDRKASEEALKRSEQKYRTIIEGIGEGYFEVDLRGNLIFFNPALCRISGLPAEEIAGINYRDYTTPETAQKMLRMFGRIYKTARPSGVQDFEIRMRDGRRIAIDLTASPIVSPAGGVIGFRGLCRDISERKRAEQQKQELEEELQRAQKMKAIGTLAGGVAHDLNNILSGIVSYPDLLLLDLPDESPLRMPIETIRDSGRKAAAIVQDLLTLARRGVSVSEVLNLNDIVLEYLRSPEFRKLESFHPHVRVERRLDSGLMNIIGSPVHLSKTVMNLVSNAAEAMPDGGAIRISTRNAYVDQPIQGYDHVTEGDYVVLEVSDAGIGIAAEDLQPIFEPFFTKKKMGRSGTGLGMAVVWGAVKDHKGYIDVASVKGQGTTFSLYFPVTRKEVESAQSVASIDHLHGGGERILVVDDVQQQRQIASAILLKLGYQVHTVSCGEAAVEYLKSHSVEMLVLDMIMSPGIDGLETYRRVLKQHPGQKAVITSGYSETDRVNEAQRLGAGIYLRKPYTLENLGAAVKQELQRR
jgi:PAS domain S-box-containing protein